MNPARLVTVSKFLSRHLRHRPADLGITLDPQGWVGVEELLAACARRGMALERADLDAVVAGNDKKRFSIDGDRIRASQGHTVPVDLALPAVTPPPTLYHGTVGRVLAAIRREGLRPMHRHDVHARRGRPVILTVDAAAMHAAGHEFRVSDNGVWLTAAVPPRFLTYPT